MSSQLAVEQLDQVGRIGSIGCRRRPSPSPSSEQIRLTFRHSGVMAG
jgi:hypothetical protein